MVIFKPLDEDGLWHRPIIQDLNIELPPVYDRQREVWEDPARFKLLCTGRRWGKTKLGTLVALATALGGGHVLWVSPVFKQAYRGWEIFKRMARQTRLFAYKRESMFHIQFKNGGYIWVRSADSPDNLRGEGVDLCVLDECAFLEETVWYSIVRPALMDRNGKALLISTPNGQNWFCDLFLHARTVEGQAAGYRAFHFTTYDNPTIPTEEVDAAKLTMSSARFAQEILAEFQSNEAAVFKRVNAAIDTDRYENEPAQPGRTYVCGVDIAKSVDYTVITVLDMDAKQVFFDRFTRGNYTEQVSRIAQVSRIYNNAIVVLDVTGAGDPVYDYLSQEGVPVHGVRISDVTKSKLIDNLALFLESDRVRLLNIPIQREELTAYRYTLTRAGSVKMECTRGHDDCVIALALACWGIKTASDRVWVVY